MNVGTNINVWTLGRGTRGRWKLEHSTASLEEAVAVFQQLEEEGRQVALYELGLFEHEGQQVAGQVAFWWTSDLNPYMQRAPEDRGVGWSEGFDTWVAYAVPDTGPAAYGAAQPAVRGEPGSTIIAPPPERYVEVSCDRCGLIQPMNRLQRYTHEVRSGRSTGGRTTTGSTSRQSQGGSLTNSTKSRSFSQSSRVYYRTETLLLCEACFAQATAPPTDLLSRFWRYMTRLD